MTDDITLREIRQQLTYEHELMNSKFTAMDESIRFHMEASQRALELQAAEYGRRLHGLQRTYEQEHNHLIVMLWITIICCFALLLLLIVMR